MTLLEVNDTNFETEVLGADKPVFVDFYATWCGPCKTYTPLVEEVAGEVPAVKFVKIDIDASPMVAQAMRVASVPTSALFNAGSPIAAQPGVMDKDALLQFLAPVMPKKSEVLEPKELAMLIEQGRAQAVDIRDAGSFGRYRIPGAVNVPKDTLAGEPAKFLKTLSDPGQTLTVLYGRTENEGEETAKMLSEAGIMVAFLKGGFLNWEAEGLEAEKGDV